MSEQHPLPVEEIEEILDRICYAPEAGFEETLWSRLSRSSMPSRGAHPHLLGRLRAWMFSYPNGYHLRMESDEAPNQSRLLTSFSVGLLVLALAAFVGLMIVLPSVESLGEADQTTATASDFTPVPEIYAPYPGLSPITAENAAQITQLATLPASFHWVSDLDFSPRQEWLAVTSQGRLTLWDLRGQTVGGNLSRNWVSGRSVFGPDGSLVMTAGEHIGIYDPVAGELSQQLQGRHPLWFDSVALAGGRLVTGGATTAWMSNYGSIQLWDFWTGALLYSVTQGAAVHHVDISPDSTLIASGDVSPVIRLWDAQLEPLAELKGQSMPTGLDFSPDGRLLASADGISIRLWDLSSRTERMTLKGHKEAILAIAFSPDGSLLASASRDSTLRLWEVSTGRVLIVLPISQDERAISPLAALQNGGDPLREPSSSKSWFTAVTFSPDGTLLAVAGWDTQVRLLGVPLND